MNKTSIFYILIVIAAIGAILVFDRDREPEATESENRTTPFDRLLEVNLQDHNGNAVSLADFKGTPLVLNSWAAWCPFCKKELPDFAAVQKKFGDKVVIIAIDRRESVETQKSYIDEIGVADDLVFLSDPDDTFYKAIGGLAMPETIFVDQEGNIRDHKRGPMDQNEIAEKIAKLLN